jgi:hypothetical protein
MYFCSMAFLRISMLFFGLTFIQCKQEEAPAQQKDINPNGSAELALLMRSMFDDGMRMKADIMAGKKTTSQQDYKRMHTATATQPEETTTPEYKLFAAAYEAAMEDLNAAPAGEQRGPYTHVVNTCIQCHQQFCTGPIRRIRKMELPAE